ncbi:hypothetical protein ACOSP7_003259 [Xanthoceras sorbifolium]
MADPRLSSSSTFQININLPATMNQIDYSSLTKTLNSNVPMKLDKSNYIYWKTQVMPAIGALDLEDYISGSAVIPEPYIDVHTDIEGERTLIQKQVNPAYSHWKKTDQILLCWLLGTLSQGVLGQVTQCRTSLEMWSKLQRVYSQQSLAKILQLRQQLQNIKKGSDSISDFVLKIKNIGDALMAVGEEVTERDLLMSLMNGVRHDYDPVVVLISNQHQTMTLKDAHFSFLMYEQRLLHLDSSNPSVNFVSNNPNYNSRNAGNRGSSNNYRGNRSRGRGGRFNGRSSQRIHCQSFAKPGHGALQCYRRFDQQFQGPPPPNNQGNQAVLVAQQAGSNAFESGQIPAASNYVQSHVQGSNINQQK